MEKQRDLKIQLVRLDGEPRYIHKARQRDFNNPPGRITPEKLLADMLKRLARRAMSDLTDCPPDTIPAHLATIDALQEIFSHVLAHDFEGTPEARASGKQLLYACTIHDYAACLSLTRKNLRAPAFINQRDGDIADIKRMICTLAGFVANGGEVPETLKTESEVEL